MQSTSTVLQVSVKAGDGANAVTINGTNGTINSGKVTVNGTAGTVNNLTKHYLGWQKLHKWSSCNRRPIENC